MIPNSVLSKQALVKLSSFTEGRVMLQLPIRHGSSFDEVKADVERIARETLGEWLDERQGVQLVVVSFDPASIIVQVVVHVAHGVSLDEARNRLAEGLSDRPWTFRV
jgi:small-conductance mechanosensitive channel